MGNSLASNNDSHCRSRYDYWPTIDTRLEFHSPHGHPANFIVHKQITSTHANLRRIYRALLSLCIMLTLVCGSSMRMISTTNAMKAAPCCCCCCHRRCSWCKLDICPLKFPTVATFAKKGPDLMVCLTVYD